MIWANIHQGSCFCKWVWACCTPGKERTGNSCSPYPWRSSPSPLPIFLQQHPKQTGSTRVSELVEPGNMRDTEMRGVWERRRCWQPGVTACAGAEHRERAHSLAECCIPPHCHHFPSSCNNHEIHKLFLAHEAKRTNSAGGVQTPVQTAFGGVGIKSILMLWAAWAWWRCPCSLQGDLTRGPLKVLSIPIHPMLLWCLRLAGHLFGIAGCDLCDVRTARSEDITPALWWAAGSLGFQNASSSLKVLQSLQRCCQVRAFEWLHNHRPLLSWGWCLTLSCKGKAFLKHSPEVLFVNQTAMWTRQGSRSKTAS